MWTANYLDRETMNGIEFDFMFLFILFSLFKRWDRINIKKDTENLNYNLIREICINIILMMNNFISFPLDTYATLLQPDIR